MDPRRLVLAIGLLVIVGAGVGSGSLALAGGVAVLSSELADNGDDDGYADTGETVVLRLTVQNTTPAPLAGVTLELSTVTPQLACITVPTIEVGTLAPGEVREVATGFEFVVADVDRTALALGPLDDLSAGFELEATAVGADPEVYPWRMRLDLDLDVSGGAGPTEFIETFEGGMGAFQPQNLDQGQTGQGGSDGWRCQYHDPDWVNSNVYNQPQWIAECHVAASPLQADAVFWGMSGPEFSPDGGRGFSGFHSMFFGIDMGPPLNWTTPTAILEAAVTGDPINLGWDDVSPTLSMMQQVSLLDGRLVFTPEGQASDRGVVMVQLADEQDAPVGDWLKLDPYLNVYDQQATDNFFNCMFDPIDDGNTEDDFYDPLDPNRRYGPSSTCFPEYSFVDIGETSSTFDAANVGRADGPAMQGLWGIGSWIESRFDLSRYRGKRIRLRMLTSALRAGDIEDWEDYGIWNPAGGDDGWWVDDVRITGALAAPATVAVDVKDNSGLPPPPPWADPDVDLVCASDNCPSVANPDQADGDLDGAGTACDCADGDATTYPGAAEVNDGIDNNCPGDLGHGAVDEISGTATMAGDVFSWPPQEGVNRYEVARGASPDFTAGCVVFDPTPYDSYTDLDPVPPGAVHFYVVRASHPNVGSWGLGSSGQERTVPCE